MQHNFSATANNNNSKIDILSAIIQKRKADIEAKGIEFGCSIPQKRIRAITPFLSGKGSILEIKRASPSKGIIAENLDASLTAEQYAKAGASAISVLTEENYFHGSLNDLMTAAKSVDEYVKKTSTIPPAILRKDFLLSEEEIEVAYRAGADAVLLISRILDAEQMLGMAKKCEALGLTALIELRKQEDLEKFKLVAENVSDKFYVTGVNSRDLKDFSIDSLAPAAILKSIRTINPNARVVFESGILTPESAAFAASMDFSGILLGEAAAKNPENSKVFTQAFKATSASNYGKFWTDYASNLGTKKLPFVKICGLTQLDDALFAAKLGADFLGFIFSDKSKRTTNSDFVKTVHTELAKQFASNPKKQPKLIAVVTTADEKNPLTAQAYALAKEGIINAIQFHSCNIPFSTDKAFAEIGRYAAVNVGSEDDIEKIKTLNLYGQPRVLIDSKSQNGLGGNGITIDETLVEKVSKSTKLWLAGGITADNVHSIINKFQPELIDVCSSIEIEPGKKDKQKMIKLFEEINRGQND